MNALEMALALKDRHAGRVDIVSMGPPYFEPYLRLGLAMGADHVYLLSDRAFGGADTLATTYTLARGIRRLGGCDLIFCGVADEEAGGQFGSQFMVANHADKVRAEYSLSEMGGFSTEIDAVSACAANRCVLRLPSSGCCYA